MSWRFACVVAACMLGLAMQSSLGGVDAKKHAKPAAVPLPYFPFPANMNPMAKMSFMMPQMQMPQTPMPRFADAHLGAKEPLGESTSQADDTDRDFVRSIYNLLSRSRDANVADNSVLERQKQETEKKQQELNRKAEILKSRAAMLTRLQYCLEKDASTEGKVLPRPPTPPQASTGPTAAQRDLAKKLADLESQLALRKKELDDMAKDLANRENNLNQRITNLQGEEKKIIQLKNDANICNCPPSPAIPPNNTIPLPEPEKCPPPPQCSHRDDDFPKIEKCVGPVVGHSRPQHVRCWKQCNRNPACFRQCLLSASKTLGNLDRFRSRRDDTAKDSETDEEEEVAPRLVVEPAAPTEPLAALAPAAPLEPAAAVVSNKMRFAAQKAQKAAVSQKQQRNPWLSADSKLGTCPGRCDLYQRCDLCAADPNCGWCSSSQRCFDVNEGKSKCAEADYSIMYCREQTCSQHRFCSSCMSDPKCGMCHSTGRCMKGGITGPADGTCNNWSYASGLRFLSLNIYGRDMSNCTARGNVIFQMLEHANADFVALQEVEDWFLELLSRQKWAANYHMSDFGSGHAPGGLLILSKVPLASVAYYERTMPGQVEVDQRGRMLVVHPKMGNNRFAFATTTLDWRSADSRADSMEYIFSVLNTTRDVVLAGDFNFDQNAQPESGQIPFNYEDVWQSLRPHHVGFTWDPATNSYAHNSDPNSRPSRIDRLLVKAGFWEARKIQKIGSPLASPHYGLLAQLELFGAYC